MAAVTVFVTGLLVGYTISFSHASETSSFFSGVGPIRSGSKQFKLIHPLIAYETPEATVLEEYATLKKKLQDIIRSAEVSGNVDDVSVYYRGLETGRWIGINQNSVYHPASLLKVPVMIAYFRKAESDSGLLQRHILYTPVGSGEPFEAPSSLTPGRSYTIQQLIEYMIIDSDNGATFTLLANIDENLLSEVYTDLGIPNPLADTSRYRISTKTYALFFRVLYNATYLTPAASEEALKILVRAPSGLSTDLPKDLVIADKFGEHVMSEKGAATGVELHACGIVYHPQRPYLLCVMTRAQDTAIASGLISSISKTVYNEVETHAD